METRQKKAKDLYDFLWTKLTIRELVRLKQINSYKIKKYTKKINDIYCKQIDKETRSKYIIDFEKYNKNLDRWIEYIKTLPQKEFKSN